MTTPPLLLLSIVLLTIAKVKAADQKMNFQTFFVGPLIKPSTPQHFSVSSTGPITEKVKTEPITSEFFLCVIGSAS